MAISIDFNKAKLSEIRKKISSVRLELSEIDEPMAKVSIMLDRWVQKNFKTEGKNVGGWKKFKLGGRPDKKGKIDTSAKLLQDTGRLRASFKPFADANKAGIGSSLDYAPVHEKGIGVPIRRMLPQHADVEKQARRLIEQSLFKDI